MVHIGAMRRSRVLEKIRNDEVARIACLYYANSMFPRHAANAGYDGVWIDGEHNSFDPRELERLLYLQRLADIDSIVRCPSRERTFLYRLLEVGATGVMIPLVSTQEETEALVDAVKFPPIGNRGLDGASIDNDFYLHGTTGYVGAANRETLLAVQIETPKALENCSEIASVPGVDVLFIGPGDLSLRLGCALDWNDSQMKQAQDHVAQEAKRNGIAWGRPAANASDIAALKEKGARFIAHGSDFGAVYGFFQSVPEVWREGLSGG